MGVFKNILGFMTAKVEEYLRPNPEITFVAIEGYNHALYLNNPGSPEGYEDSIKRDPRRTYHLYPRDIDETKNEEEQLADLQKMVDITVPKGFFIEFGRWSKARKINLLIPNNIEDLPEEWKPILAPYIMSKKAELDIIELARQTDIDKTLQFKKVMSTLHGQFDNYIKTRMDTLVNTFKTEQENMDSVNNPKKRM